MKYNIEIEIQNLPMSMCNTHSVCLYKKTVLLFFSLFDQISMRDNWYGNYQSYNSHIAITKNTLGFLAISISIKMRDRETGRGRERELVNFRSWNESEFLFLFLYLYLSILESPRKEVIWYTHRDYCVCLSICVCVSLCVCVERVYVGCFWNR